jgi:aconitate hydratase
VPNSSLTAALLDAHRVDAPGATDRTFDLRPDHVLAGGVAAVVTLGAFEALGVPRIVPDVAVVGAERHGPEAAFEDLRELRGLQEASQRAGAHFVRPGEGRCEQVHLERLAAPGRVMLCAGRRAPLAGALGMLAIPAGALEAAAALAGQAVERERPTVLGIRLEGTLAPGLDGHDVVCALVARLGAGGAAGRWLEFGGAGAATLGVASRLAVLHAIERLDSPLALFPSDDAARRFLAAQARDSDWRRFESDGESGCAATLSLALDTLEPMVIGLAAGEPPRPVREHRGEPVGVVVIGPGAAAEDLERLAAALRGRRVRDGCTLRVLPGSRQVRETAQASGALDLLRAAGADVTDGALPPSAATLGMSFGASEAQLSGGRTRWRAAGLASCAAAALTGQIEDPRDVAEVCVAESPLRAFAATEAMRAESESGHAGPARAFPIGRAFDAPLRGTVLTRLPDRVSTDRVLPWGARVRSLLGDFEALGAHTFAGLDPEFPARALARSGGFVVAGERCGEGWPWDTTALVLVQLGVRAVMAESLAPAFARLLAQAGVLPLEWVNGREGRALEVGDELEIPGLPETFVAGRPLVVRDLSRGTQYTLRHMLDSRQVGRLRRGGLLADLIATRAKAG